MGRQTWPIFNLLIAALIIIFIFPQALFEVSFQLTFAATLGIMTLGQSLAQVTQKQRAKETEETKYSSSESEKFYSCHPEFISGSIKMLKRVQHDKVVGGLVGLLKNNAAVATSAYVFTAPVILFYFGRTSLISPLTNILVAEAVFPIMVLGFLVSIASLIFMPLAQILAYLAYVPAFYFIKVIDIFAGFDFGQIILEKENLFVVTFLYGLLIAFLVWRNYWEKV